MTMRLWAGLTACLLAGTAMGGSGTAMARPAPLPGQLASELHALADYDTSGDPQAALNRIDALLAKARKTRGLDPVDLLLADATRGEALFWLGRYAEALAVFRRFDAEMTARGQPMTPRRADIVNNIGSALSSLGKLDEAHGYKQRALAIAEEISGPGSSEYAAALYGLAVIDYRRGLPLEAIPKVEQALAISRAAAERTGTNLENPAIYGITLSTLRIQAGDSASAVDAARDAASWAEARLGKGHRITLASLNALGAALNDAGLYGRATPILRRALDLRMANPSPDQRDVGYSLNALAYSLDLAGFSEEARPFYERSAAIFEALPPSGQSMSGANIFGQIARIARDDGETETALALYRKALALARRNAASPDDPEVLWAEFSLAKMLNLTGDPKSALALLDHVNAGYAKRAQAANLDRISGLALRGLIDARQGDPVGALERLKPVLATLREHLLDRASPAAGSVRLRDQASGLFVLESRVALAAGDMETAFGALQMAGMGDLQTAFGGAGPYRGGHGPEAEEAIRAYRNEAAELRALRRERDRATGDGQSLSPDAAEKLAASETRLVRLDAEIARLVPGHTALSSLAPAGLIATRAHLRGDQAVLLYGQDAEGLVVLAVTRGGIASALVPVTPRRLLDLQRRLRGSIEEGVLTDGRSAFDRQAAHELYTLLFPTPIARAVHDREELAVLAQGTLAALPFDLLVTAPPRGSDSDPQALRETPWLVRTHAVGTLISASTLSSGTSRRAGRRGFVGIGAPVLRNPDADASDAVATVVSALPGLPSLPGAGNELAAMAATFRGERRLLLGSGATEAAVKAAPLDRAGVIAFATHGLVGGAYRNMLEPALVLTPPADAGGSEDGLLTASEIARLKLDADWVILSACDTSAGDSENAPTYSGLAQAFISAGARSLLLSHWPVRDDVASRLTLATVKGARGHTRRAEALRRAQLDVLGDRSVAGAAHPAIWAPFVLVGN
ncbi:tetratricopeptide repeat protein [Novosphingobium sp. ST904]|nr:tetratricopeptide repeat protein [Novosphingobium sp. ST904]